MPDANTIINAQVTVALREKANAILRRECMSLSAYIRHCLERLVEADGNPFNPDDYRPLAGHLLREIEAGGPEADALVKRLMEIAAR